MRRFVGGIVSAGLLAGFLTGCATENKQPQLKVATVDIMRIMEERPETVDIRLDWKSQAGQTYMELSGVQDEAEAEELQKQIERRSQAWQKRMDTFMEESIELVEEETARLAKERGLDLVVVDNPLTKTVRYKDGEDLTLDVSLQLQNRD